MKKIILGVFIFLILLVVVLPFVIPTKFIADKISDAVENALHKETVIENVKIAIVPRLGIRVTGLQIGVKNQDDYFVTLESLFLELQWKPLLKKQISISQIALKNPVIEMYTVTAKEQTPPTQTPTEVANSSGAQLHIDALTISDAEFTMFDGKMKPTAHLEGLSEKMSVDYNAEGTSTLEGTTVIPVIALTTPMGELGRNMRIEIEKKIQIDAKNLNIQNLKIKLGDLPVGLEGSVADYNGDFPTVDLKFSGGPADIGNIVGLIPAKMLPSDLKNVESKGNLLLQGKLKGKIDKKKAAESIQASDFSLAMTLTNGEIKTPQLPKPMSNIGFAIGVDPKRAEVKNFSADFGGSTIRLTALVTDYLKNPVFDFTTKSTIVLQDVASLRQDLPAKNLRGNMILDISASGATKNPMSTVLNGSIGMNDVSMEYNYPGKKYNIENFNTAMKLAQNNITIQKLALLVNGSDFSGTGKIDNPMAMMGDDKNSLLKFNLTASSKNLDADQLMPPPGPPEESAPLPPSFFKLDGDIKSTIEKLTFNKLAMSKAVGNIGIHRGLIKLDPLSVHVFGGTVALAGEINMNSRHHPSFDLDTQLTSVKVEQALAYADNIDKLLKLNDSLKADIGLKARAKGELTKEFDLNIAKLNSTGSFSLNNAVVKNHPIQKAFAKYFKSDKFDSINVKQWTQTFSVENGKINVNDLNFGAQDFSFNINGWQSLDGKNDFSIDAKLPPSLTAKITDQLPGPIASLISAQKQITLPFNISGEASSPSIGLNNEKLKGSTKDLVKEEVKAKTEKLKEDLKADAKGTLKDLVGGEDGKGKKIKSKDAVKKQAKDIKNKLKNIF